MPRPLVFGNGNLLIGIDERYCIRDLFYPQVGLHNHLNGHRIGMGVWANGRFAWTEDASWQYKLGYRPGTLTGLSTLENATLGLSLEIEEAVCPRSNDFIRLMRVRNLTGKQQEVKLFFTHDLRIMENDIGDTALYDPFVDGMVHYKGPCYFLFGGSTSQGGVHEYATGIKGFAGLEGTWRDAEDGKLSMHPISQGSVDSTLSLKMTVGPNKTEQAIYWIVCGDKLEEINRSFRRLVKDGFIEALEDSTRYWAAWSNKLDGISEGLPAAVRKEFRQSVLIMRTQIDNQGAIIAANDTDIMRTNRATYSYMWPRDGAFVSTVFDRAGYRLVPRKFFTFCRNILPKERPVLLHKYMADGSVGATWHPWIVDGKPDEPFQEDESALTLEALWRNYQINGDLEFLHELYEPFVVPMADFIVRYRDPATCLPLPSYDLWEERRGVHTFTTAAVVAGLRAASEISTALGNGRAETYRTAAEETAAALVERLFDQERGVLLRRLAPEPDGKYTPDLTIDSATLQAALLGAIPPDHPVARSTAEVVERTLTVRSAVGGLARYEGDYYFRVSDDFPGNPWIICTMWLAQYKIMLAKTITELAEPMRLIEWATGLAASTGVFSEQVHPITAEPLSVSPLTWSHAEYVKTVMDYADKVAALGGDPVRM
jgi:GH15 family glucan-1,4-alpha-glucosidase